MTQHNHGKSYRTCRRRVNFTVMTVTMGNLVVKETCLFSFNSIQLKQHSLSYCSKNAQISLYFQETAYSAFLAIREFVFNLIGWSQQIPNEKSFAGWGPENPGETAHFKGKSFMSRIYQTRGWCHCLYVQIRGWRHLPLQHPRVAPPPPVMFK